MVASSNFESCYYAIGIYNYNSMLCIKKKSKSAVVLFIIYFDS